MQQAVMLGIIDSQKGLYVNSTTGDKIPIPVAMNAGWIKVRFNLHFLNKYIFFMTKPLTSYLAMYMIDDHTLVTHCIINKK